MKKRNITIILVSMLIFISSLSGAITINQEVLNIPSQEWDKTFGGIAEDGGDSVRQTSDGGYIITGYTFSYGEGDTDVWLIKTDENGNKLWDKTFGGIDWDQGHSVKQTIDGGYIITGYTTSYGAGNEDVWLIKTDSSGNEVWEKTFGSTMDDVGREVYQTNDGGYIIIGYTTSYGAGNEDVWLIKTDSSGNKIWDKTFGGTGEDLGYSLDLTDDDGFIITGYTTSYGAGSGDVWLIKTDSSGNKLWDKTFGGSDWDRGRSIRQTTEGGYIIAGSTMSYGSGSGDIWIIKTDPSGNKVWEVIRGGNGDDRGRFIRQTSDQGYIVTGYRYNAELQHNVVILIKIDVNGNIHWNNTFSGDDWDRGLAVEQTIDDGFIVCGYTKSYGAGDRDVWLIKVAAGNNPPYKPTKPSGPTNGEPGETYIYSSTIIDLDEDPIYCIFDWGDGTDSGWLGPYNSGKTVRASHEWTSEGIFEIKAKAKDIHGEESAWSDSTKMSTPKSISYNHIFLQFLERIAKINPSITQINEPKPVALKIMIFCVIEIDGEGSILSLPGFLFWKITDGNIKITYLGGEYTATSGSGFFILHLGSKSKDPVDIQGVAPIGISW